MPPESRYRGAAPSGSSGSVEILDWSALGNLGATETITGVASSVVRAYGTLDQACTVTISLSDNQQIEFEAIQDGTGSRPITFSGVDIWTGSTPSTSTRAAGARDVFKFSRKGGVTVGTWVTEVLIGPPFRRKAGTYCVDGQTAGTMTPTNNRGHFEPLVTYQTITMTDIGINVSTNVAATTGRLGLVADDGGGVPGTKIADFGTIDTSTTGIKTIGSLARTITPGIYWIVFVIQGTGVAVRCMTARTTTALQFSRFDTMANAAGNAVAWPVKSSIGDPLPTDCSPNAWAQIEVPKIAYTITVP